MWIACTTGYRAGRSRWVAAYSVLDSYRGNIIVPSTITPAQTQRWLRSLYSCTHRGTKAEAQRYNLQWEENDVSEDDGLPYSYRKSHNEVQWKEGATRRASNVSDGLRAGTLSRVLAKHSSEESVVPRLKKWIAEGNPLPKNVVIIAVTNLKRSRRYKQALEIADFAWKQRLFEMSDVDHMYRLYLTGQAGSIEDVEKCFAGIPSEWLTESVYNQLISCYIARGMIHDAKNALENLKNSGKLVSALPYNQFMSLYRHQREPNKALELMKEMNEVGVTPDTRTYNCLLSMTHKQGDADGVLRIYKSMTAAGVAPDIFTCSLVAKSFMLAGLVQEAESVANEMQRLSPTNCHLTHDLLLTIYGDLGKHEELQKLWAHVQSFSELPVRSYGVMIESLGKLGLIQEAEELALKVERKKGKLISRIFNAMMDVYARHGMMQAAEALMIRIHKDRLRANSVTYQHLITGYLKVGQIDRALEYLRTSRESLIYEQSKPWFESFLLILERLAEVGDVEVAESTFEVFTRTGSYRSTTVYNHLLKSYLKGRKPATNFLQRMFADGIQPDAQTLALLKELESVSDVKEAENI